MTAYEPTDPRHKELARQQLAAQPPVITRETIDAELRELSDSRIAQLVEYDAPAEARLAAIARTRPDGFSVWDELTPQERRGWRARNEQARRRAAAARQGEHAATAAEQAAKSKAAGDAQRAELRQKLSAAAPGLRGDALEAAIDRALTESAIANMDRLLEQKRAQIGGL